MSRLTLLLILAALCLLPLGCTFMDPPPQMPFAGYPYRYNRSDFKIAWKTEKVERGLAVEVMLKNLQYASVSELTLETSLNRGDEVLAKRSTSLAQELRIDEHKKLGVKLRNVAVSPGDQLHFLIRYQATEGGITRSMVTKFAVDAVTGDIYEDESSPD